MVENKIFQVSPFIFPEDRLIFIDIETDLACQRVWLIGLLIDSKFIQLYADSWDEEKKILSDFLAILKKHPGYTLVSYSGTNFDYRVPLYALMRVGLKTDLLESHQHFDLSHMVRNCFVFPNQSFALKELGAYLKYPFMFPDLNGMFVAFKYMKHVEDGEPLDEKVIKYNEDDVRVLPFIISTLKSNKLPIFFLGSQQSNNDS
jgi:predicted RecB family nuclease